MTRFTGIGVPLMALAGIAVLSTAPLTGASAQTCADQVEAFAATHGLSTQPPPKAPPSSLSGLPPGTAGGSGAPPIADGSGGVTSEELADSGGVIAPPDVAAPGVIEPPPSTMNDMPTAPTIRPDAGMAGTPPASDTLGRAALGAQMEAMVTGALAAADEGDEARCLDTLAKAEQLAESGSGEPPARKEGQ